MSVISSSFSKILHQASYFLSRQGEKEFSLACMNVEEAQNKAFNNVLASIQGSENAMNHSLSMASSLQDFKQKVPVTDYDYWSDLISKQQSEAVNLLTNSECSRYQPTSGSTSKIKWIPYNQSFLDELDNAIAPWLTDLYRTYPKLKNGKHYWSLSWVPSDLRNKLSSSINNDLQLLPWWKQIFMSGLMAVPESISLAETSDESFFATSCYLVACKELSFISVWSPTFALSLLDFILTHRDDIATVLATGAWPKKYSSLHKIRAPKNKEAALKMQHWDGEINAKFTSSIWPDLALISAWDTSSSKIWADKLKQLFPHSDFQGKGLWATEGVTSIPYKNKFPLAINSHFYEFEDLATETILDSWQLKKDMVVRPIISSANGFLRYAMKDQLKVTDFIHQCPCFEFIGRIDGTDMVGEKLSPETAVQLINNFNDDADITPITLIAIPAGEKQEKPSYLLLCEHSSELSNNLAEDQLAEKERLLAAELEQQLSKHFHYQLARELGQLAPARVSIQKDALSLYADHKVEQGMVKGNIKVEPLVLWQNLTSFITERSQDAASPSADSTQNQASSSTTHEAKCATKQEAVS